MSHALAPGVRTAAGLVAILLVALVGIPVLVILTVSLRQSDGLIGVGNFLIAYSSARHVRALVNSFELGLAVCAVAASMALPLAWAVARTDIGGKHFIDLCAISVFLCPPYLNAVAWIFLAGPNAGLLNKAWVGMTGAAHPVLNIYSFSGIAFVMGSSLFFFVFSFTSTALEAVSSDMEEAASILGAGRWTTAIEITLPLVAPAILAALVIVFLQAIALYGVPALLAYPARFPLLVTSLLEFFDGMSVRLGPAAAYAMPLVLVTITLLAAQKFLTRRRGYVMMTGKSGQRELTKLGTLRLPATIAAILLCGVIAVLPIVTLVQAAFSKAWGRGWQIDNFTLDNLLALASKPSLRDAVFHSILYASASAVLATAVSLAAAYLIVRQNIRLGFALSLLAMMPSVIPAIVLSIGFYATFSAPPVSLYGTGLLLILAFSARFLPITYSACAAALVTFNPEMEDAARILGASRLYVLARVTAPMLKSSILASTIMVFVLASHELSTAVFLSNANNRVVSVAMLDFADNGQMEAVATMGVCLLLITLAILSLGSRIVGHSIMRARGEA